MSRWRGRPWPWRLAAGWRRAEAGSIATFEHPDADKNLDEIHCQWQEQAVEGDGGGRIGKGLGGEGGNRDFRQPAAINDRGSRTGVGGEQRAEQLDGAPAVPGAVDQK
ncbi:MAG: hypothetical protein HYV63_34780 [Candidatus Schekmanbacteria bacterium]|nr:hypothetical protein [Candidatus Schekmanbacteria bacterium]